MNTHSENPSRRRILACLLRFFADPAERQAQHLSDYAAKVTALADGPHVNSPPVELAEAVCRYRDLATWDPELSSEVAEIVEELATLLDLMLEREVEIRFSPECFNEAASWRLVRRLAADALERCARLRSESEMTLWELLCYVSD
jgi:hypothetical protein